MILEIEHCCKCLDDTSNNVLYFYKGGPGILVKRNPPRKVLRFFLGITNLQATRCKWFTWVVGESGEKTCFSARRGAVQVSLLRLFSRQQIQ